MNTQTLVTTKEEFLDKKKDYSPFLVHLTRNNGERSSKEILECILKEQVLKAYNYFCLFNNKLNVLNDDIKNRFKVVCFTETPIDQINLLLERVQGRNKRFESYGLVFEKNYIRKKVRGGNPTFYAAESLFDTLWQIYESAEDSNFSHEEYNFLALVNKYDTNVDFHWEREWRITGNFKFELAEIFCGLCPEKEMTFFETIYSPVKFISPTWGINKILYKLVKG